MTFVVFNDIFKHQTPTIGLMTIPYYNGNNGSLDPGTRDKNVAESGHLKTEREIDCSCS